MSHRTFALAGIASAVLSATVLLAGPVGVAHATPSIPIPPPVSIKIMPKLMIPNFKPSGPCTACSPTLPLPPPRAGQFLSR